MSGYWPTVLEMFQPAAMPATAVGAVQKFIDSSRFHGDAGSLRGESRIPGLCSMPVSFLGTMSWMDVDFSSRVPNRAYIAAFDSSVYEKVFDPVTNELSVEGVSALVSMCAGIASSVGCEGFRLKLQTAGFAPGAVDMLEALASMNADPGLLLGVAVESRDADVIMRYWSGWVDVYGYRVAEFLS